MDYQSLCGAYRLEMLLLPIIILQLELTELVLKFIQMYLQAEMGENLRNNLATSMEAPLFQHLMDLVLQVYPELMMES